MSRVCCCCCCGQHLELESVGSLLSILSLKSDPTRWAEEGHGQSAPALASCFANESMFRTINQKRHARATIIPLKAIEETEESGPRFSAPGATDPRGLILETCQGKQGHGKTLYRGHAQISASFSSSSIKVSLWSRSLAPWRDQ